MDKRKKKAIGIGVGVAATGLVAVGGYLGYGMIRYQQIISDIELIMPDLARIPDGRYNGSCDAVQVAANVDVVVEDHKIKEIVINEHKHGYEKALEAEPIILDVVEKQSFDVDMVSGATNSSKVILEAVENALESGLE